MPADMKKMVQDKDLILDTIRRRGPSLPVHVARAANLSPLFAAAYLSELYGENKIKMSVMRVGSSPLYYIAGQEASIENFIEHLNQKEREVFTILKQEKILDDSLLAPAHRVAIRELKDFAVSLKVNSQDASRVFWKYHLLPDSEAAQLLNERLNPAPQKETRKIQQQKQVHSQAEPHEVIVQPLQQEEKKERKTLTRQKKPKKEDADFADKIKEYLTAKEIEVLSIIPLKKKECTAQVRIDTPLGKQEFHLTVKDKKRITCDDLTIALHAAQQEKMPSLVMSPGALDKDAQEYLRLWRNLIKFETIRL